MESARLERPVLAVDVVVLRVADRNLEVVLTRRTARPFAGQLALPGVAVRADQTLAAAAQQALRSKAGFAAADVERCHMEQLATFDALFRDPRGRTVSVAHLALVRWPGASPPVWHRVRDVPRGGLPFDHGQILEAAVVRLAGKLRYTNLAAHLLPETFRIEELERVYVAILGRRLNRANFRARLLKLGLIQRVKVLAEAVGAKGGRPPHLYRFTSSLPEATDREFL
jgi:8-oxo-dGTP diphosphatase